jgi:hypothetical protein
MPLALLAKGLATINTAAVMIAKIALLVRVLTDVMFILFIFILLMLAEANVVKKLLAAGNGVKKLLAAGNGVEKFDGSSNGG